MTTGQRRGRGGGSAERTGQEEGREKRGFSGGGAREEKARVRVYRRKAAGDQKIRRGK
jgi:hypothetical protein